MYGEESRRIRLTTPPSSIGFGLLRSEGGLAVLAGDAFGFMRAAEKSVDAEVVVQGGPVDAGTGAASFPVAHLFGGGLQECRVPCQRHADDASVREFRGERLVIDGDILNFRARRTHGMQ
jgi:hypothetical protein